MNINTLFEEQPTVEVKTKRVAPTDAQRVLENPRVRAAFLAQIRKSRDVIMREASNIKAFLNDNPNGYTHDEILATLSDDERKAFGIVAEPIVRFVALFQVKE